MMKERVETIPRTTTVNALLSVALLLFHELCILLSAQRHGVLLIGEGQFPAGLVDFENNIEGLVKVVEVEWEAAQKEKRG